MTDPYLVPELTRAMRTFASPHALGDTHDRYFAPLLDARRSAKSASRWSGRVSAFDADRIEATIRAVVGTFAAERFPGESPERRALAARLEDSCSELFGVLDTLRAAQAAVTDAADDESRVGAWTAWVACLQRVFNAADRGWEHISPLLAAAPVPVSARRRRTRGGR